MSRLRFNLDALKPKTLLPFADLLLVNSAVLAGLWLWTERDDFREFSFQFVLARGHWFLAISVVWLLLAAVQDFYQRRTARQLLPSLITLAGITSLLILLYFVIYFFAPRNNTLPRGTILSIAGASFLFVGLWRLGYVAATTGLSRDEIVAAFDAPFDAAGEPAVAERDSRSSQAPAPLEDEVLTVQEVADHLKVSQATVWRWCKSGKLPAFRVGQQWRIRAADLHTVVSGNLDRGKG